MAICNFNLLTLKPVNTFNAGLFINPEKIVYIQTYPGEKDYVTVWFDCEIDENGRKFVDVYTDDADKLIKFLTS